MKRSLAAMIVAYVLVAISPVLAQTTAPGGVGAGGATGTGGLADWWWTILVVIAIRRRDLVFHLATRPRVAADCKRKAPRQMDRDAGLPSKVEPLSQGSHFNRTLQR
jgi:hypothetical protein